MTVEAVSQQAFARGGVKTGPSDVQVDFREVSNQAIGLFSTSGRVTSQRTPVDTFDAQVSFTADTTPGRFLLNPFFEAHAAGSASAQTQVSGSYTFLVDTSARARIRVDFSTGLASSSNYAEIVESGTSRSITRVAFEQGRKEVFVALAPGNANSRPASPQTRVALATSRAHTKISSPMQASISWLPRTLKSLRPFLASGRGCCSVRCVLLGYLAACGHRDECLPNGRALSRGSTVACLDSGRGE